MISIRENVFETNSSSCHSVTLSSESTITRFENPVFLEIVGGDWQWEWDKHTSMQEKFSYWFNAFIEYIGILLEKKTAIKKNIPEYQICSYLNSEDYIDNSKNRGPCDPEVYKEVLNIATGIFNKIIEEFNSKNVNLYFKYQGYLDNSIQVGFNKEYSQRFNATNHLGDIRQLYQQNFKYIVNQGLGIDHASGVSEGGDCEKLAELTPPDVVKWVLGDGYFWTGNDNEANPYEQEYDDD